MRGVINARPPGQPQACGKGHAGLSACFVLVTGRPSSGQRFPSRLGLGTPEPSGPAGAQGPGRAAADSGMRLVITFARPGRLPAPRFLPRAEPSSCIWILSLLSPREWRQHLFQRPSLYFTLPDKHQDTDTRCLTREDAQKRRKTRLFSTSRGKKTLPVKKVQTRQGGRSGGAELIAPPLLSRCPPYASLPSTTVPRGREPRSVPGPKKQPSSSTSLAALKSDPKEFRIRFQNTAEPSRTNTPRCRGREENQGGQ